MAELSGILRADFSSFYAAVDKAEADLRALETSGDQAGAALDQMSTFQGDPMAAELDEVAAATEKVTASQKELQQTSGAAGGGLDDLKSSAAGVTPEVNSLMGTFKQFDDVLELGGPNLLPYVKGLEQLGEVSGKTTSQLGFLGTAGAALGVGMAAWGITRATLEFFGLTEAVDSAVASLFKFGDLAGQTAGAQQDTINRAIAQGAAATISYTEAIDFNARAMQKNIASKVDYNKRLEEARTLVAGLSDADMKEIAAAQQLGATEEFVMTKFNLTADAVKVLTERTKAQEDADRKAAEAAEAAAEKAKAAWENYANARSNAMKRMHAEEAKEMEAATARENEQAAMFEQLDIKARINRQAAADAQAKAEEETLAKAEAARVAANQKEIDDILKVSAAHTQGGETAAAAADLTTAGYQQVAQQIEITGEAVKEWINLMKYTAEAQAILSSGSGLFTTQSQRERLAAIGGGAGGGQQVFNNTFQIVDTESNIAKRVSDNIMGQVKAGTQLGTA